MTYPELYAFNDNGLNVFKKVFDGQIQDSALDPMNDALVSSVPGTRSFTPTGFDTAKAMAQAVLNSLDTANLYDLLTNAGLWAWLTFVMRDLLFKKKEDDTWKVGELDRWFPSHPNNWQKGQRHLVRMPVLLLNSLNSNADHLLCGPPSVLPEIREQLTSQQDMFTESFQKVARRLYFDDVGQKLKPGVGGKGKGSPRRLARVRKQLDVTWDLEELDANTVINMLPDEFSRFKPSGQ